MPVSEYVRDQSCRGAFLAYKENSVSNTIDVKTEVLVDPYTEAKKVPKSASTTDDIE
jgi:hypothetical protein